jgi:hypothetical protein
MIFNRRLFEVFAIALALIPGVFVIISTGCGSSESAGDSNSDQNSLTTNNNNAPTLQDFVWAFVPFSGQLKAFHDHPKLAPLGGPLFTPFGITGSNLLRSPEDLGMSESEYRSAIDDYIWGAASDIKDEAGLITGAPYWKEVGGGLLYLAKNNRNNKIPQEQSSALGSSSASSDRSSLASGSVSEKKDLGGINFTSIKLNSIAISTDQEGGINLDLILKAQKAEGKSPGIDLINSTRIGATAFITGLVVPDNKFWVNLEPWEVDRIIDEQLRKSDVGRIMLEADLQMKRDIHYYDNPCATETGVAFWNLFDEKRDALVEQCMKKFPGDIEDIDNVQFFPVERHWIVPDKIYSYTNGTQIYVINATLTINSTSEEDRSSFQVYNQNKEALSEGCREELNKSAIEFSRYVNMLQDRMILPYVIADVNHDEKYEDLRDVYVALALAQWYKSKITPHMDIFRGSLDLSNPPVLRSQEKWSPQEIWDKYVYSFKNGEYKCWKNETTKTATGTHTESSPRSAGGVKFASVKDHMVNIEVMPPEVQDHVKKAVSNGFINEGGDILFGNRIHVSQKDENIISGTSSGSSLASLNSKNGAKCPSNENGTDNATVITNEKAGNQNKEISSVAKDTGNATQVTCPKGWSGPDKNGECWQLEIKGKS